MSDSDDIMQGFLITGFVLIGLSSFGYCIRLRMKNHSKLKQSSSMEDLNSVDTQDPESGV